MHQHGSYPEHPVHWPHHRFQLLVLYLQKHCGFLYVGFWESGDQKWAEQLPLVRLYISLTVSVERSLRGWPLSPPTSDLLASWSVSGLDTVVLVTIKPSTPSCKHRTFTKKRTGNEWHTALYLDSQEQNWCLLATIQPSNGKCTVTKRECC